MYIVLFLFLFFISLISIEKSYLKIVVVFISVILILFAGTRLSIAADYDLYYASFYDAVKYDFFLRDQPTFEYCMYIIPNFVSLFFSENFVNVSFLFFAFLGVTTKMFVIKKADFFILSFFLYFTNLYFVQEMITIRAGVASGIFLLSINDLERNDKKNFFFKMLLALLFHYSSLIFIVIWFFLRFNIKYYLISLVASFLVILFNLNILTILFINRLVPKVQIYLDLLETEGQEKINLFNFKILFAIFISIFFFIVYRKLKNNKLFVILFKIHLISLILFFALSTTSNAFSLRIFELLSVVQILLYPMIVLVFKNTYRYVAYGLISSYCLIQFFYIISFTNLFADYKSWLF